MKDHEIIELYWARNESAITATTEKYGNYCHIPSLPPCRRMTRIIWSIYISRKSTRILLSSTNGFRENRADL